MSLRSCMTANIQPIVIFDLKTHIAFVWTTIGWCVFDTVSDDVLAFRGIASLLGNEYRFNVRITTQPGQVLTVNGTVDKGATLSGCTLQAQKTLGGKAFELTTYDATTTRIVTPVPIPDIYIVPQ